MLFVVAGEDREEYEELLKMLRDDYQPIGRAEELEVERIALCWLKFQRVWRHENAVNSVALRDKGSRELGEQTKNCQKLEEREKAVLLLLQSAMKEIEVTGEISQELKRKMFAAMPDFEVRFSSIEDDVKEMLNLPHFSKMARKLNPKELSSAVAQNTVTIAIQFIEQLAQMRRAAIMEIAAAQHIIPNSEALDKILRYETTIDRSLTRSLDRLEHRQKRRRREPVLPPASACLTR